jgi:nucleolar protein 15
VIDPPTKKSKKVPVSVPKPPSEALPKPILKKTNPKEKTNGSTVSPAPKANGDSTRTAKPRKRAADFLSDDDDSEAENTKTEIQKEKVTSKGAKKQLKKPADGETSVDVKKSEKQKKSPNKTAEKAVILPEKSDEASAGEDNEDEEEDLDDQTADLIRGFESSGDEDPSDDEGLDPDQPVPRIPDSKKAKRKIVKKQKKADTPEEPGTVYVG